MVRPVRCSVKGLNEADRVAFAMAIDVGDVLEGRLGVGVKPKALREVLEGRVVWTSGCPGTCRDHLR